MGDQAPSDRYWFMESDPCAAGDSVRRVQSDMMRANRRARDLVGDMLWRLQTGAPMFDHTLFPYAPRNLPACRNGPNGS